MARGAMEIHPKLGEGTEAACKRYLPSIKKERSFWFFSMLDLLAPLYPWIKAAHVIAAMLWLGGQCVLLMLLAAHAELLGRNKDALHLGEVERRCFATVVNPAMLAALVFGMTLFLLQGPALLRESWFQVKLPAVVAMAALHGVMAATHAAMRRDGKPPARGRIGSLQVAGLALTAMIVSLAVVK